MAIAGQPGDRLRDLGPTHRNHLLAWTLDASVDVTDARKSFPTAVSVERCGDPRFWRLPLTDYIAWQTT